MKPSFCVVVPHYDHVEPLGRTLSKLASHLLPIIVVDDGSPPKVRSQVISMCEDREGVSAISLRENSGKGGAVKAGLREALRREFTHAIQIDADGQHDLSVLPTMMEETSEYPDSLIAAHPMYDESVPMSRLLGRKLTNFMVVVETLSKKLPDVMCGFRIYPLDSIVPLLGMQKMGERMDFDIEIMVRAYWEGVNIRFLPVHVRYPEHGVSHFRLLRDNALISFKHAQLVFGMFPRIPSLIRGRPP